MQRRAAERIVFAGARTDAPDWLAAADVVAAPSRWEGMSFAMLETMASARSLVMTDVPGARDALGADAAGIVPVGDQRAIAAAIIARLLDPELAAAEGSTARSRVERFHDIRDATSGVAELYGELLGIPHAGAGGVEGGGDRAMRIDYLIRAHTAPEQLARLVQRLDGRDARFYVHVNRLTDDETFETMQQGLDDRDKDRLAPARRLLLGRLQPLGGDARGDRGDPRRAATCLTMRCSSRARTTR